jgi:hypothetical protein
MRLEDPLRWPFRQPVADRREATPIHDSLLPVSTPVPCLDFVWGDHVVPFVVRQPYPKPVVGRAQVPVGLIYLVFPAPACDPALLPQMAS